VNTPKFSHCCARISAELAAIEIERWIAEAEDPKHRVFGQPFSDGYDAAEPARSAEKQVLTKKMEILLILEQHVSRQQRLFQRRLNFLDFQAEKASNSSEHVSLALARILQLQALEIQRVITESQEANTLGAV